MDTKEKIRKTASSGRSTAGMTGAKTKQRRRVSPVQKKPAPEVVYTQPEHFNRSRFMLRLLTVLAVVLALSFGMAIFFKVDKVTVTGAEKYTAWQIREASGIQNGENLLSLNKAKISSRIMAALPYVSKVRVGIKLPDSVNIEIVEREVVYAIAAQDDSWWLMASDGTIVERTSASASGEYTVVIGVTLKTPQVGSAAVAAEPQQDDASAPITILGAQRLSAVISILQYLEQNGILGQIVSVDVSDMDDIELWYGQRYQVFLGDATQLGYKIEYMKKMVDQMSEYQTGIIDVSFTTWPDEGRFAEFS